MISEQYKQDLAREHAEREHFGKRSSRWAASVMQLCAEHETNDVLDYGCGKGELNLHLPFGVQCYDPGVPKFDIDPEPADVLVCTDVLEHIEPAHLDEVLAHIRAKTLKVALLAISTIPAIKHFPDGRNFHLIIEDAKWWEEKIMSGGRWTMARGPNVGTLPEDQPKRGLKAGDPIEVVMQLEPREAS